MEQTAPQLNLEGEITTQTIPNLIQMISQTGETGVFWVADDRMEKKVYFKDGQAIFAASNVPDDRLGALFLRKGLLSIETLAKSGEISFRTGKRLGTVLVEFKCIRPEDLIEGVSEQVQNILLSIFDFIKGKYRFDMGELPTTEMIQLRISTGDIILQGVRRINSWSRIWQAVGDLDTSYRNTERIRGIMKEINLSLEEWTLLSVLDKPRTLRELCLASQMKDFDICKMLWAFQVLGIARRV
jgi:hypothetical protein